MRRSTNHIGGLRSLGTFAIATLLLVCAQWATARAQNASHSPAPSAASTPVAKAMQTTIVSPSGQDITLPSTGGFGGNMVLTTNNSPPGTRISVSTATTGGAPSGVVATIALTFDHSTAFNMFPSFFLTLPSPANSQDPYVLEIYDGTTSRLIVTLDQFEYGNFVFFGGSWYGEPDRAFSAIAGHSYLIEVVTRPPTMAKLLTSLEPQTFALPTFDGLRGSIRLPSLVAGGGTFIVRMSDEPPVGVTAIPWAIPGQPTYYATLLMLGVATYNGEMAITLSLPSEAGRNNDTYSIAVYDTGRWTSGWRIVGNSVESARDRTIRFGIEVPTTRVPFRRYVFALNRAESSETVPRQYGIPPAPALAVIGDSMSFLTAFPTTTPCRIQLGALPMCQYSIDRATSYPALVEQQTGYHAVNLSWPAIEIDGDTGGESALALEVPQIPQNASIVVMQAGGVDVAFHPNVDRSSVVDTVTAAIKAKAPAARIIYLGQRYFSALATDPARKPGIDAWNARERNLAEKYGRFIDLQAMFPPGINSAFPDGNHATAAAHRIIASAIAAAVKDLDKRSAMKR